MKKVLLLVSVLVLFVTGMAFSQLSIAVDAEKDAFYQTMAIYICPTKLIMIIIPAILHRPVIRIFPPNSGLPGMLSICTFTKKCGMI